MLKLLEDETICHSKSSAVTFRSVSDVELQKELSALFIESCIIQLYHNCVDIKLSVAMNYPSNFVILIMCIIIGIANARIYHLNVPRNDDNYPVAYYTTDRGGEQASKNLDLTFSAGDPSNNNDDNDDVKPIFYPSRQNYISPMLPVINMIHEDDRPRYLYKWPADMSRKFIYPGDSSFRGEDNNIHNLKFNNGHKGEVILELRVIANNGEM